MRAFVGFAACVICAGLVVSFAPSREERMALAARGFQGSLTPELLEQASFDFDDAWRTDWHYVPRERKGVRLGDLSKAQRGALDLLLASGLSGKGIEKVEGVLALEKVLFDLENGNPGRDPGNYSVSIFGEPGSGKPWGWKLEGHHLSLNYSTLDESAISVTPHFFGAAPAKLSQWKEPGVEFRVLGSEEDCARAFLAALDDGQREAAVHRGEPPGDILLVPGRETSSLAKEGLGADALGKAQLELLLALVSEFTSNVAGAPASRALASVRAAEPKDVRFLWIGSIEQGEPFYFRVHTSDFVYEYENGRPGADHIHVLWRDVKDDFGAGLLASHLQREHGR
jgi:hypothetical protein